MSVVEVDRTSEPQPASETASARRRSRVSTASRDSIGQTPTSIRSSALAALPIRPPSDVDRSRDRDVRVDTSRPGRSAEQYYYGLDTPTSTRSSGSIRGAIDRHKSSSYGQSSRSGRDHIRSRDLVRLLLTEHRDSKDALTMLNKTAERMELETQRANEAERKLQEANDKWRAVNQARLQAQAEANRLNEELRLYKLQLEAAQSQIARANDMITQTDREKSLAEDEAAKAKRLAKKYEMETLIQKARDEGRRLGREQGLREGREQGYYSAYDEAYFQARDEAHDRYVNERGGPDEYEDQFYPDEEYEDETTIPPTSATVETTMPIPQPQRQRQSAMRQQPMPQPSQQYLPDVMHVPDYEVPHRRKKSIFNRLRYARQQGQGDMAPQIEINDNAPDVATIVDNDPGLTVATPVPETAAPQVAYEPNFEPSMHMPEPDLNPDPSTVGPITIMGPPQSPSHPRVDIPPDGFIPRQRSDGTIGIPPPHEFLHSLATPRSTHSPLPGPSTLPVEPAEPVVPSLTREPVARDYGNEPTRRNGRHRYQRSVADSVASTTISNLSILSPPGQRNSIAQPRLSAIPEASPNGSMSQAEIGYGVPRPSSRNSMNAYATGMPPMNGDGGIPGSARSRPMDLGGTFSPRSQRSAYPTGPPRPSVLTTPAPLVPGYEQAYTRPRRESDASGSIFDASSIRGRTRAMNSEYNRGRPAPATNVMQGETPEITIEPPSRSESQQSRKSNVTTRGAMSPRMRARDRGMNSSSFIPEGFEPYNMTAGPVAGSEQLPDGFVAMTPRASQTPLVSIPEGLPPGFIPSPTIPDNVPAGFIPSSPAVPAGFVPTTPGPTHARTPSMPEAVPPGFVPTSPAAPPLDVPPPGFVPTSPAMSPMLDTHPPGFMPTSPAMPSGAVLDAAPPGFIPGSPAPPGFVPTVTRATSDGDGLGLPPGFQHTTPTSEVPPPGFMPHSPNVGAPQLQDPPLGFMPASTTIPQQMLPGGSPAFSMSGALPILPRSASGGDVLSAWGASDMDVGMGSTRPGTAQDFYNSAAPSRAPTAMSRRRSVRDSGPVIPDPSILDGSHPASPRMRRASRHIIGADPAEIALPPTTAPSYARSNSASRPAYSRAATARSDASAGGRPRANPYASTTQTPSRTPAGLPTSGLSSPYSRRLQPHPEDALEDVAVASTSSNDTLTTPPMHAKNPRSLPGAVPVFPMPAPVPPTPGTTAGGRVPLPAPSAGRGLSRTASRASIFLPPDPDDAAAVLARTSPYLGNSTLADGGGLRRSSSRASLHSHKSYEHFDRNDYVDPAVLASGAAGSAGVALPQVEPANVGGRGKKTKAKGKGKKR